MTKEAHVVMALTALAGLAFASSLTGCVKSKGNSNGSAGSPGFMPPAVATGGTSGAVPTATGGASGLTGTSGTAATGAAGASGTGTAGTSGTAGATGIAGSGAAGTGTAGTGAAGTGTAGTGAAGTGAAGGAADATVSECIAGVMAAGMTVTDCETCLCQVGNCQPEVTALKGDTKGNALVACSKAHMCSGECCLCGTSSKGEVCDKTAGANFGTGPCGAEVQTADGKTPGTGLQGAIANSSDVMSNCTATGPDPNNSCTKALKVAKCAMDKCASMCPNVAVACP